MNDRAYIVVDGQLKRFDLGQILGPVWFFQSDSMQRSSARCYPSFHNLLKDLKREKIWMLHNQTSTCLESNTNLI
jgi:hypothetical protein